jgi:large subunit ribosomal protein L29
MAEIKMSELREKDQDSLVNLEKELTENLFAARLQKRTGQLENTAKIAGTKRDLARVKTVLRARELGLEVIETPTPGAKTEKKKVATKPSKSVKVEAQKKKAKESAKKPAKKAKESKKADAKPAAKKAAAKPAAKSKKAGKSAGKKK